MDTEKLRELVETLREESRKDKAEGANKEWAEWLRERYMATASAKWDAARRIDECLAAQPLIAELGQELGAVACNVEGSWLWCKLMDFCRNRRLPPAEYNDLFAIASEAHKLYSSPAHTSEARDAEIEAVKSALDRAYWLGQEYWRDETRSRYNQLVIDTLAAMRQEAE